MRCAWGGNWSLPPKILPVTAAAAAAAAAINSLCNRNIPVCKKLGCCPRRGRAAGRHCTNSRQGGRVRFYFSRPAFDQSDPRPPVNGTSVHRRYTCVPPTTMHLCTWYKVLYTYACRVLPVLKHQVFRVPCAGTVCTRDSILIMLAGY